jgi:Flp pilus assembly protein TadG
LLVRRPRRAHRGEAAAEFLRELEIGHSRSTPMLMNTFLHPLHHPLRRLHDAARDQRGVALVEFALVLPILVLMLFGALDFGKAYNYWIDETHLANEGARYAAVNTSPDPSAASFLAAIRQQADSAELRNGNSSSVPNALKVCVYLPNGPTVGSPVRVEVTSTYRFLSFIANRLNLLSKSVVADSTMRLERVPSYTDGQCA